MERREPPPTESGWFALHDFRTVDWPAWREAAERDREAVIEEGTAYLESALALEDAETGSSGVYAVLGHKADLLVVHLRPTLEALNTLERRFETTALAGMTERATSYVSVTEASGYTESARPYFEGEEIEDEGLARYIDTRLHPTIPEASYVSFYPMSKRRDPEQNWYDLPFDERAAHMANHGQIGRSYAGRVSQMITSSIGFDDHEWGVTLWANDPVAIKDLLYEMRFDPSTSRFAEFGSFYVGRRLDPDHLRDFLQGEAFEAGSEVEEDEGATTRPHDGDGIREELADLGVYAGQPHGEDVHAVVVYSEANSDELFEAVVGLRGNFDHYDTHVETAVYESRADGPAAVVSLWETESAADTAAGFISDLPGVVEDDPEGGFGTMGMFYTVKPEHREAFFDTYAEVADVLEDLEGHVETSLLVNREDENNTFIASRWRSKDDAMAFFRSEAFRDTVSWGREVLADRPRHVFLHGPAESR